MKFSDLKPGQRFTRNAAVGGDDEHAELVALRTSPDLLSFGGPVKGYAFDPETFKVFGTDNADTSVSLVEAKRNPEGTINYVALTDAEVRVLEFAISQIAAGDTGEVIHNAIRSAASKLRKFGLTKERRGYHFNHAGKVFCGVSKSPDIPTIVLLEVAE